MTGFGKRALALALALAAGACVPKYTLVPAAPATVTAAKFHVTPGAAWNRAPRGPYDIAQEENWTRNGATLDAVGFIGALPDGKAIVRQRKKADQKVPIFRADMTPQDLAAMIESFYRIRAGADLFFCQI